MRHDPTISSTGRHGNWVTCSCGWTSRAWTTIPGAYADFGQHLLSCEVDDANE